MLAVTSAYEKGDKSAEAMAAKNEVLNKQIDAQKQKLEQLKLGLSQASEKYGENDKATQGWQQAVNKATADLNNMERELKENAAAADKAGDEIDEAGKKARASGDNAEKGGSGWSKMGGVLKRVAVAAGAAAVAAGAATIKLGKEVISAYADYEQLVGGVDTLFQESSGKLQGYASNAYKTAGLSANDYMETVTSFSASLIQSLAGDTEKAVTYADMAITDMSDNANKMGSDMASIQTAYQGFAKMNYTMLDNLKLGYGGTKSEMERLLKDAEAIAGVKFDVSSYSDIVAAIHVVQESMGIAGTTALEAEHTISGSINSMQAALRNLIAGFGNADADIQNLTGNLVDAFQSAVKNITPVIENIVKALPQAIDAVIGAIGDVLPALLESFAELFGKVLKTLLVLLPKLIPAVVDMVITIVEAIIDNVDLLVEASVAIIIALAEGLIKALPRLIEKAPVIVVKLAAAIIKSLPQIALAGVGLIKAFAESIVGALGSVADVGKRIVLSIWDGISNMVSWFRDRISSFFTEEAFSTSAITAGLGGWGSSIVEWATTEVPKIIAAIADFFSDLPGKIGYALGAALGTLAKWGTDATKWVTTEIPKIISYIVNFYLELPGKIGEALSQALNVVTVWITDTTTRVQTEIPKIINSVVTFFSELPGKIATWLTNALQKVTGWFADLVSTVRTEAPRVIDNIVSAFSGLPGSLRDIGIDLVRGLWSGITSMGSWLRNQVYGFAGGIIQGFKDSFSISSPSGIMRDQVGKMIGLGIAEGISDSARQVKAAMAGLNKEIEINPSFNTASGAGEGSGYGVAVSNIYMDSVLVASATGRAQYRKNAVRARSLGVVPA